MWWLLAAVLVVSAGASDLSAVARSAEVKARGAEVDRQTQTVTMPAGKALSIDLTIGAVRIDGWDKDTAEIVIERHAPSAPQFSRIPPAIEDTSSRIAIRVVQPDNDTDPAYRADVTVRLPHNALIERIHIVEGRLSLTSFDGSITADVRRGPIDGKNVAGSIRLQSEIGSVTLSGARLSSNGLLRLRTFNGDVRVSLSERPSNARILALALNGNVKSDIPLTLRESWGPRWGEATLGNGESVISLDVVTGTVEIKSP